MISQIGMTRIGSVPTARTAAGRFVNWVKALPDPEPEVVELESRPTPRPAPVAAVVRLVTLAVILIASGHVLLPAGLAIVVLNIHAKHAADAVMHLINKIDIRHLMQVDRARVHS